MTAHVYKIILMQANGVRASSPVYVAASTDSLDGIVRTAALAYDPQADERTWTHVAMMERICTAHVDPALAA